MMPLAPCLDSKAETHAHRTHRRCPQIAVVIALEDRIVAVQNARLRLSDAVFVLLLLLR